MDLNNWLNAVVGFLPLVIFAGLLAVMMRQAKKVKPDKYQQLETLANLKDRGAVTEREFEIEKRKLLGGD